MNKKKKKEMINKGKIFYHTMKQEEINGYILSDMIEKHNTLEKGYKNFLNDFKMLLCFNVLQIIMFIILFFSMQFYNLLIPAYLLIIVAMMFAYILVIKKLK